MKGLINFISEIRISKTSERESRRVNRELAKIRKKFKFFADGRQADSYQKMKYLCKLMYIYLLGYDINFGHIEAVNMTASSKFLEKQIAYLFISLLCGDESMLRLIVHSLRLDLCSEDNEVVCLALKCIANNFIEELAEDIVNQFFLGNNLVSSDYLRSKATLCLLSLYRRDPSTVPVSIIIPHLFKSLGSLNLGLLSSTLSLLLTLAIDFPDACKACLPKLIHILSERTDKKYIEKNGRAVYINIKILQMIRLYPPLGQLSLY
ncbi:AP-2 complex subunit alpha-1-like [Zophobas morio]|uniref:AP-2 complex subunit alpha-1-like n=1 Tax=Zophobas morio TaxID=2755281 RepID=UPI0030839D9E